MALEASDAERREVEYATQFFGFTPEAFTDTAMLYAVECVEEELKKLKAKLQDKFEGQELDDCFEVLKDKYLESNEKVLNKFAKYLKKNILSIPKHVILPDDEVHQSQTFNGEDLENGLSNIDQLCAKIRNAKYKRAILQAKLLNLQKVNAVQETLFEECKNVEDKKNQMEALLDPQLTLLQGKVAGLEKITSKLEKSPTKRKQLEKFEDHILAKKFKCFDDD